MPAVRGEKLLTASDLAALCEVDLKTIHNWVDRGRIAHFRTPGRHLRFRAADVAEFLRAWGYAVPRELARLSSRVALAIGSKDIATHVGRALGEGVAVRHANHPYDALVYAGAEPADAFLVDVRAVAPEIDVNAMLEAIHRACPQAIYVALADDATSFPSFVTRVARNDAAVLKELLAPEPAVVAPAAASGGEEPPLAAGGSSR